MIHAERTADHEREIIENEFRWCEDQEEDESNLLNKPPDSDQIAKTLLKVVDLCPRCEPDILAAMISFYHNEVTGIPSEYDEAWTRLQAAANKFIDDVHAWRNPS